MKILMLHVKRSRFAWALRGDRPLGTPVFLLTPTAGEKGFARFSRAKDSPRHVFSKQPSAEEV